MNETPVASSQVRAWLVLFSFVLGVGLLMGGLYWRALAQQQADALSETQKGVTTVLVRAARYQALRRYVGTVFPWLEARVGPQFTSAYIDTVAVRPGDQVQKGAVLATLVCKSAQAQSQAQKMQAQALGKTQEALNHEAARMSGLLSGGFVSVNEVERRTADSATKQAELLAAQARLSRVTLEVDDCVLRAPFDGEVAERLMDPGGFVRPGTSILSVVDRQKVRIAVDVPEKDLATVAVGTPVKLRLLALGVSQTGVIARRAPVADGFTRTIHAEVDVEGQAKDQSPIPIGSTAEVHIQVGQPVEAGELPVWVASIRDDTATVYTVQDGVARKTKVAVLGEAHGSVFVAPTLPPGTHVIAEGKALLRDGDRVAEQLQTTPAGVAK